MKLLPLAVKLLWRDSRAGELTLLLIALIIAITSSTTISLFADRLQRTMLEQTAEFLAADLVVTSHQTLPKSWIKQAQALQLASAQTAEFSSMLLEHDEMLLASVKAVTSLYPLRGFLKITHTDYSQEHIVHQGPPSGTVWVEPRVLSALKLKIGDYVTIGEKPLRITQRLTYETDKQGDFYSFSPRVMMNATDLPATGIVQPGSHVHYFFQYRGESKALLAFKHWLKPQLNPSQRIMDIHEDRPELGSALSKAERYLGLSNMIVILISGVAIAMATRRYTERHFNTTALLRCLGLSQNDLLRLYGYQLLLLGLLASSIGCLLGWLVQQSLFHLLRNLLPQQVANPGWLAVCFGFINGMLVLLAFALPPLLRLKRVSPLRVLRRDLAPLPTSAWLVYGVGFSIIAILLVRYAQDVKLAATFLGVGLLVLLLLGLLIYALLQGSAKLLPHFNLTWRFGLQGLLKNQQATLSQLLAFSITLVAMVLSFSVRNDLINTWQQQLPSNAPNHFALNIFPEQQAGFQQDLINNNINSSRFYPIVKGRLVAINTTPVQKRVSKDSQGDGATHRELSLTWTEQLPEGNTLSTGQWWPNQQAGWVSVEQKLADSLGIKLGDQLLFTIGSQKLNATVTSLRVLDWNTMRPNFYMIFSPGTLETYPSTYLTSFYVPDNQSQVLNVLLKRYPAITLLDVNAILKQFKTILGQLTKAIDYLVYFSLLAGLTVLFAAVYATLDQRIQTAAILRTLGASRALLRKIYWIEFGLLGFLSGVLTMLLSEALLYGLYAKVMHLVYHPTVYLWLVVPLASSLLVALAGYSVTWRVVSKSPVTVLREL